MPVELDLQTADGRTVHVYDTGSTGDGDPVVIWHHGTPNTGEPPRPLFDVANELGIRWVSFDRPSYGGSTPHPGRSVASSAADVAVVADALEIDRFAAMGHSGGATHALASGALLADRTVAIACLAALAPRQAEGLDWFEGMIASGAAALRSAMDGREAKMAYETAHGSGYDPEFTPGDLALLAGEWSWLGGVASTASTAGPDGLVDDDIAYVSPWGFRVEDVMVPCVIVHGGKDRIVPAAHGVWLAGRCPSTELRLSPEAGHISILSEAAVALRWLREHF